jgi:hypothetical protein
MPEATQATGGTQQREDNRSFLQKHGGTIFQMVAMWMVTRFLFGGGKYEQELFLRK